MKRAALIVAALLAGGCCNHDIAHRLAQRAAIVNKGHAGDEALAKQTREVALDNLEAWLVQAHILGGDPLPEYLKARHADDLR